MSVITRLQFTYINDGNNIDVIYLDFVKAFDKVPHERLLLKLSEHGIRGNSLTWIRNWLCGRKQRGENQWRTVDLETSLEDC